MRYPVLLNQLEQCSTIAVPTGPRRANSSGLTLKETHMFKIEDLETTVAPAGIADSAGGVPCVAIVAIVAITHAEQEA